HDRHVAPLQERFMRRLRRAVHIRRVGVWDLRDRFARGWIGHRMERRAIAPFSIDVEGKLSNLCCDHTFSPIATRPARTGAFCIRTRYSAPDTKNPTNQA